MVCWKSYSPCPFLVYFSTSIWEYCLQGLFPLYRYSFSLSILYCRISWCSDGFWIADTVCFVSLFFLFLLLSMTSILVKGPWRQNIDDPVLDDCRPVRYWRWLISLIFWQEVMSSLLTWDRPSSKLFYVHLGVCKMSAGASNCL